MYDLDISCFGNIYTIDGFDSERFRPLIFKWIHSTLFDLYAYEILKSKNIYIYVSK